MPLLILIAGAIIYLMSAEKKQLVGMALVDDAIAKGITAPLGLPDVATVILRIHSKLETAAWGSRTFMETNSLFNRHIGSGRGDWKGSGLDRSAWKVGIHFYYAGVNDQDVRMFLDVYQSARDMAQLLSDPLYAPALAALKRGHAGGYFDALGSVGFAAKNVAPNYAADLKRMARAEGILA